MRTIQLTHEEVETIKQSLTNSYTSSLNLINNNRLLVSLEAKKELINSANSYLLAQDAFDGERDV